MNITAPLFLLAASLNLPAEPLLSSWYLDQAGSYARIWQTIEDETIEKSTGVVTSVTTWDADAIDGNPVVGTQSMPIYAGVQGVSYSANYVYIKATGMGVHTMGPWYNNSEKTILFQSFPINAAILYRYPRDLSLYTETYTSPMNISGLGTNGIMVDGVPIFNSSDGASYENEGDWNQDAYFNEGRTFDAANAHQAGGNQHYHANPAALRHLLNDSVDYDPTIVFTGAADAGGESPYTESPSGEHSPIIGWVNDGLPMYGPYGYSNPSESSSPVRRMVSGYQMRDGSNGSYDLSAQPERNLFPQWKVDLNPQVTSTIPATNGPTVDATGRYRLGTFIEDYAYKGDLVSDSTNQPMELYRDPATQGTFDESNHYDLNQFNVRYCVTPEFPNGIWAYFTSILADGTPFYPYNVANNYFGDSLRAAGVNSITEPVTVIFDGAVNKEVVSEEVSVSNGMLTITWDAIEGGTYRIDSSESLETNSWVAGIEFTSDSQRFEVTDSSPQDGIPKRFHRLVRTGVADYDDTEFSTSSGGGPGGGPGGGGPPN